PQRVVVVAAGRLHAPAKMFAAVAIDRDRFDLGAAEINADAHVAAPCPPSRCRARAAGAPPPSARASTRRALRRRRAPPGEAGATDCTRRDISPPPRSRP